MKKKLFAVITFLILLMSVSLTFFKVDAAEDYLTINLVIDRSKKIVCPLPNEDTSKYYLDGDIAPKQEYEVYSSNTNIKTEKKANGNIIKVMVKKSEAEDLILNIVPKNESYHIYSRYFQVDLDHSYQTNTSEESYSFEGDYNTELFTSLQTITKNSLTWSKPGAYHYQKFMGYGSKGTSWGFTMASDNNCSALCVKDINGAEKTDEITINFAIFTRVTVKDLEALDFSSASNGSSTQVIGQSGLNFTEEAYVSTNNRKPTKTSWASEVKNSLKKFEKLIDITSLFYISVNVLTSILALIICTLKLATAPSHPIKRRETIMQILGSVVCLALTGGITMFVRFIFQIVFG